MIKGFLIDYIFCVFTPFRTFFIVLDIDECEISEIFAIGLILDVLYDKLLINTFILLILHYLFKMLKLNNLFIKNLFIFLLYFNISFFVFGFSMSFYLSNVIVGFVFYLLYFCFVKHILKW